MLKPTKILSYVLLLSLIVNTASTLQIQGEAIVDDQKLQIRSGLQRELYTTQEGLIMNQKQLDYMGVSNCKFSSNTEVNLFYCDKGKMIVQDASKLEQLMIYKLPKEIADQISQQGADPNRSFKVFQSKLNPSESLIQIVNIVYLTKFDNLNIKIDMYDSFKLDFMLNVYTQRNKWNYKDIDDIQLIDKRIMAGSIFVNNTDYRENVVFFHKNSSGNFTNSQGQIVGLDSNKTTQSISNYQFNMIGNFAMVHYLDKNQTFKKVLINYESNNCNSDNTVCEFVRLNIKNETIDLGKHKNEKNIPKAWSLSNDTKFVVLAYSSTLYAKIIDDGYSWTYKPDKASRNIGKAFLQISKIPVASNNNYLKEQYKITYSAEKEDSIWINQAHIYQRDGSWKNFPWEELLEIKKDSPLREATMMNSARDSQVIFMEDGAKAKFQTYITPGIGQIYYPSTKQNSSSTTSRLLLKVYGEDLGDFGFKSASYGNCPNGTLPNDIVKNRLQPFECISCGDTRLNPTSSFEKMLLKEGCPGIVVTKQTSVVGFFLGVGLVIIAAASIFIYYECFQKKIYKEQMHKELHRDSTLSGSQSGADNELNTARPMLDGKTNPNDPNPEIKIQIKRPNQGNGQFILNGQQAQQPQGNENLILNNINVNFIGYKGGDRIIQKLQQVDMTGQDDGNLVMKPNELTQNVDIMFQSANTPENDTVKLEDRQVENNDNIEAKSQSALDFQNIEMTPASYDRNKQNPIQRIQYQN